MKQVLRAVALLGGLLLSGAALAQSPAWQKGMTEKEYGVVPFTPHHVIGNIYFVGTRALSVYLIATPAGNILINTGFEYNFPLVRQGIEKLGFKLGDTKILLTTHAHNDMAGGAKAIIDASGAKYAVMDADVSAVESGGELAVNMSSGTRWPKVKVDRVLHDGDTVELGGTVLTAHLTPGHSRGTTSWGMTATEGGKRYRVVLIGGIDASENYKLVANPVYPQITEDFYKTFRLLKALPADVYLGARTGYYGMEQKFARVRPGGPNPFIDPEGYKAYIADREQRFLGFLKAQTQAAKAAP